MEFFFYSFHFFFLTDQIKTWKYDSTNYPSDIFIEQRSKKASIAHDTSYQSSWCSWRPVSDCLLFFKMLLYFKKNRWYNFGMSTKINPLTIAPPNIVNLGAPKKTFKNCKESGSTTRIVSFLPLLKWHEICYKMNYKRVYKTTY